ILRLHDIRLSIEHIEHVGRFDPRAPTYLIIVEVMTGRDLDCAGAELWVGMLVGNDWYQPARDRLSDLLADNAAIALVLRMDSDGHVGEHGFGPGGCDLNGVRAVGERIVQRPELALDFARLDLEVADRGLEPGVPIHEALVAIDEASFVQLDKDMG